METIIRNLILFTLLILPVTVKGMTVKELLAKLKSDNSVTVIDIRSPEEYKMSHIPSAINIPAKIIKMKRLPGFGKVVVYNNGIDVKQLDDAVQLLNEKTGITANKLEGGFIKWQEKNNPKTGTSGLLRNSIIDIDYNRLRYLSETSSDLIIVDLRKKSDKENILFENSFKNRKKITVLKKFNNSKSKDKRFIKLISKSKKQNPNSFFVLIDDGNGKSEKLARKLVSKGIKKVGVLTGGNYSLINKGKPVKKAIENKTNPINISPMGHQKFNKGLKVKKNNSGLKDDNVGGEK